MSSTSDRTAGVLGITPSSIRCPTDNERSSGRPRVAVVVSGWPRVSETFAANELLALRRAGMLAGTFATKLGDPSLLQPQCEELADVQILPTGDAFVQGTALAARLRTAHVSAVHGYFAHHPAAVAQVAASLLGVPFGFSVHALDARKVDPTELQERAKAAACVIACNGDVAESLHRFGVQPTLTPHGVDLVRFRPREYSSDSRTSSATNAPPPELLAIGRLIDKKGFLVLVRAMALMQTPWRLRIVGDGPNRVQLATEIAHLGLADRVELHGRVTHEELPGLLASATAVVVPSVIDAEGDRDGLPNVVLEAMASGRPVVASDVAAISTAVEHGRTGVLVPPGNSKALATALDLVALDPSARRRFAIAGRALVERNFDLDACSRRFCDLLERAYA